MLNLTLRRYAARQVWDSERLSGEALWARLGEGQHTTKRAANTEVLILNSTMIHGVIYTILLV
jgi:hypothetical protein